MADILIVDDDVDLASTMSDLLVLAGGHEVRTAHDGHEGLAQVDARFPDLILLDIEMPHLDGPGMAYVLLIKNCGRQHIPIVLVSGYLDLPRIAERVGTPYALAKPCSPATLLDMVDRALTERIPPRPQGQGR
jgi:two-component system, NtrC family, C4-dicarboxylate transport response regulator DctD